jgi:hypothetical protein
LHAKVSGNNPVKAAALKGQGRIFETAKSYLAPVMENALSFKVEAKRSDKTSDTSIHSLSMWEPSSEAFP